MFASRIIKNLSQKRHFFSFVERNQTAVITRFGSVVRQRGEGLVITVPLIEKVEIVNNAVKFLSIDDTVKTGDDITVKISTGLYYKIEPENSVKALYSLENTLDQIKSCVSNGVRSFSQTLTLDQIYQSQNSFSKIESIQKFLEDSGRTYIDLKVLEIKPDDLTISTRNKVSESERLTKVAEFDAKSTFLREKSLADARYYKMVKNAEALSEYRRLVFDGINDSVTNTSKNLNLTNEQVLQFFLNLQKIEMQGQFASSDTKSAVVITDGQENKFLVNTLTFPRT